MTRSYTAAFLSVARKEVERMPFPMSLQIRDRFSDPFFIIINCLLSLRARDVVTLPVSLALFARARTPVQLLEIPVADLEQLFRPLGFYRNKTRVVRNVSREIIERFDGHVPQTERELLSIKGVGRKTANLVLSVAFNKPALCVDTHVHRLSNALGLVHTKKPEQTEIALKKSISKENWALLSQFLVTWGQQLPRKRQVPLLQELIIQELNKKRSTRQ